MPNPERSQVWKDWFREHGSRLLLFARQQARSEAEAEDVLQEAVLRLWKADGGGDALPPDLPLAFTAIRHAAIDHARKTDRRVRREQASDYVADDENGRVDWFGSGALEDQERKEMLESAMKDLPEKFREVLVLKIWGEQTFAQIAESLGIPQNTAASRYRYGLEALRKSLAGSLD